MKAMPAVDYMNECFRYEDGTLIWKKRPATHFRSERVANMWNAKNADRRAGRVMPCGAYRQVGLDGRRYLEHRVIAALHGISTEAEIDHRDGNGLNNRVENLRAATRAENMRNTVGWSKKSERVGVSKVNDRKWVANIRDGGRQVYLGAFGSEREAELAREQAEKVGYGEFAGHASREAA